MANAPTTDEVIAILGREKKRLTARFPLHTISVFDSVARGEATPDSDVDMQLF
jgi:predicted nucleotidyltransferase